MNSIDYESPRKDQILTGAIGREKVVSSGSRFFSIPRGDSEFLEGLLKLNCGSFCFILGYDPRGEIKILTKARVLLGIKQISFIVKKFYKSPFLN